MNKGKIATFDDLLDAGRTAQRNGTFEDYLEHLSRDAALSLLDASPWIIALIAEIGRLQAKFYGASRTKRGDRKDAFNRTLFALLYQTYLDMTGRPPDLETDRDRNPDAPAVKWAKDVCDMALNRARTVFQPSDAEEDAIRNVASLRGATIVDHFRAAKKYYQGRHDRQT